MITIEVAVGSGQISSFAAQALQNRLYVSGWMLSGWLTEARRDAYDFSAIVLAYKDNIPVGVLVCYEDTTAGIFVRKSERRQNIASGMVQALTQKGITPTFTAHDEQSKEFFESVDAEINLEYDSFYFGTQDNE